ncbi:MAG TPA: acetyl ornithine aminotransferase family protein [Anaerolineaceae bacterium]|nr:acetyl ornithine aminotransferase family protein [Chloroflexota bacterium]HNS07765.1 acetyl ornithine aminotransferase family protein [Anaerolineaceae bacterium]
MNPTRLPGQKALEIIQRDQQVISPSYPRGYPFVMDHGKGVYVWDVDGNRFLDFAAGIAVNSTGHSHPDVVKAIQDQAEKFIHISSDFYHAKWVELAEYLNRIAPFKEDAVIFQTNSGTESVESALKLARYHTGRSQFISFMGGFHGRTYGAVTLTASKAKYHHGFFPLMNGVTHVPFPDPYRPMLHMLPGEDIGDATIRFIEKVFIHNLPPQDVAGIIIEPIQGEGGYVVPPDTFILQLRELCSRHGILLIADEVQSGVGRTGRWWAIENFGVEPDIVTTAKGIASGMPLGAMIARKSITTWPKGAHGNTYGGNPLACVASLETLRLIENGYMQNAKHVGSSCLDRLAEMQVRHPSIGAVRGMGLMIGIEFVMDRESREPAEKMRDAVVDKAFELGLLTLGCGTSTIRISPPLCITREEIDEGLTILDEAITFAEK